MNLSRNSLSWPKLIIWKSRSIAFNHWRKNLKKFFDSDHYVALQRNFKFLGEGSSSNWLSTQTTRPNSVIELPNASQGPTASIWYRNYPLPWTLVASESKIWLRSSKKSLVGYRKSILSVPSLLCWTFRGSIRKQILSRIFLIKPYFIKIVTWLVRIEKPRKNILKFFVSGFLPDFRSDSRTPT